MFHCKIVREVSTGNVYKTIFSNAIKSFGITNNPMVSSKSTNEKHTGTYMLTIRTLDRKEYHITKEYNNYKAVNILYELIEAKLKLRKHKKRHIEVISKLDEKDRLFFSDLSDDNVMIHSEKLENTLNKINSLLKN